MIERESKRLKNFFTYTFYYSTFETDNILTTLKTRLNSFNEWVNEPWSRKYRLEIKLLQRTIRIIETNNISNEDLLRVVIEANIERKLNNYWCNKPIKPNRKRDNKVHNIYGYSSACSKVRFPSKKRSKATWKRFYTMFPKIAEEDKWDGKNSTRIKFHATSRKF